MAGKSSRMMWADKLSGKSVSSRGVPASLAAQGKRIYGTILGIDPSLRGTGLALVTHTRQGEWILERSETVRIPSKHSMAECLGEIFRCVTDFIDTKDVTHVALEESIYVQNFQTAQVLGSARGAAITAAAVKGLEVHEYPPLRIKQAVVGYGRASKDQVAKTIMQHLGHVEPLPSDEADATAVALCHAMTYRESL